MSIYIYYSELRDSYNVDSDTNKLVSFTLIHPNVLAPASTTSHYY